MTTSVPRVSPTARAIRCHASPRHGETGEGSEPRRTSMSTPGSAITLGAGALFGVGLGTIVVSIASTTAAAVAFPLARTLLRSRMERLAAGSRGFAAIDDAVAEGGWRVVGLLRLSPVVPFSALNYLLGLTRVPYVPAILVSWAAMLPGTLLYVYLGAVGTELAAGASKGWEEWTLLGVGLAATLAVTIVLTRAARARMRLTNAAPIP